MGKHSVVIVEDQQDLAEALKDALSDKGFEVRTATTAEVGIELIKEEVPDVLLLDFILPGMSGVDMLEALKPIREEKNFGIVMLSNVDNPNDLQKAREYDIDHYLVKTDWRLEDVIKTIKGLV